MGGVEIDESGRHLPKPRTVTMIEVVDRYTERLHWVSEKFYEETCDVYHRTTALPRVIEYHAN